MARARTRRVARIRGRQPGDADPRDNGALDVEVLIECHGVPPADLPAHLDRCWEAAGTVLQADRLTAIRLQAAALLPLPCDPAALFLDGLECGPDARVMVVLDTGDLDQVCATIDASGDVVEAVCRA